MLFIEYLHTSAVSPPITIISPYVYAQMQVEQTEPNSTYAIPLETSQSQLLEFI